MIRRIQNRGYATLPRIADHIDALTAGDESNAVIEALDAVNLMTVHASKGLEFPIVFVVNMAKGASGPPKPIRVVAERRRRAVRLGRAVRLRPGRGRPRAREARDAAAALRGVHSGARSPVPRVGAEVRGDGAGPRQPGGGPPRVSEGALRTCRDGVSAVSFGCVEWHEWQDIRVQALSRAARRCRHTCSDSGRGCRPIQPDRRRCDTAPDRLGSRFRDGSSLKKPLPQQGERPGSDLLVGRLVHRLFQFGVPDDHRLHERAKGLAIPEEGVSAEEADSVVDTAIGAWRTHARAP